MEIETKKVWDFSKENFVNRLIQNEIDGKLIEYGEYQGDDETGGEQISESQHQAASIKDINLGSVQQFNKKIESLNHEYNSILVKTLQNQRRYFEEQIKKVWDGHNNKMQEGVAEINRLEAEIAEEDHVIQATNTEVEELKEAHSDMKQQF